ncbi:hypothetical protein WH367_16540 [Comamonas sp. MYb21]|uniref:hypothetical protein n=1 Tax=Comamonas sp. MYb21 TaxID=1848648 RepID=UPI0030B50429
MSGNDFNGISGTPQGQEPPSAMEAIAVLAEHISRIETNLMAYQHLVHALYATHPDRAAVKSKYLDHMDHVADSVPQQAAVQFREAMQRVLRELT